MADPAPRPLGERLRRLNVEFVAAAVLGLAALLSAWGGYQASLFDGDQAAAYTQAEALRTKASTAATQAGQLAAVDAFFFREWLNAYAADDLKRQDFFRRRFRPEFKPVFETWFTCQRTIKVGCPDTPFVMKEYVQAAETRARMLNADADATFQRGEQANDISDSYVRAGVILAAALFFGGICQVFNDPRLRLALAAAGVVACAWGAISLLSLPLNSG